MSDVPKVNLALRRADAVVLFEWLMEVDEDAVPVTHPAQKRTFRDLLNRLEVETDVAHATREEIEAAKQEVARDMLVGGPLDQQEVQLPHPRHRR